MGIYYYRARWYDPGSGRFISQDPIGFRAGDVNLYRYVGNAPGDATDPLGKSPTLISGGIGAAGGFVIGGAIGWWNGSGFWSGAGHGFVIGGVTGLTAGVGAGLFGGAAGTVVGGTVGGFIGGATTDAVTQGVEIGLGWREEYSFTQNVFSGSIGSIFGAGSAFIRTCKGVRTTNTTVKVIDIAKVPEHSRRAGQYNFSRALSDQNVIRYYTKFVPSRTLGKTPGARYVTEVNATTGAVKRTWQELYDASGRVIEVHPKTPVDLGHISTGN